MINMYNDIIDEIVFDLEDYLDGSYPTTEHLKDDLYDFISDIMGDYEEVEDIMLSENSEGVELKVIFSDDISISILVISTVVLQNIEVQV